MFSVPGLCAARVRNPSHLETVLFLSVIVGEKAEEMTSGGDSAFLRGRLCMGKRAVMMKHGKNSCWEEKQVKQ